MSLSGSTEKSFHPSASPAPLPWSPTSATQGLSNPGSFPPSESTVAPPRAKSAQVGPGQAFETTLFDSDMPIDSHSDPVLVAPNTSLSPMKQLLMRIDANDRQYVRQLPSHPADQLKIGIDLNAPDYASGRTPLTAALLKGHLDIAVDLLVLGADTQRRDAEERAPCELVACASMGAMVLQFVSLRKAHGAPSKTGSRVGKHYQELLTAIDPRTGHTLLTWAISRRHQTLVEWLLRSGPDFRIYNRFVRTALEEACVSGSLEVVSLLLDAWPDLVSDLNRRYLVDAIRTAAESNRPMAVAHLLSFFRQKHNAQGSESDKASSSRSSPDALAQKDLYQSFLGIRSAKQPTIEKIMHRTHDDFLLTEDESRLLELDKIVAFANQQKLTKVVEIIHAHAKLPADDSAST